MASEFAAKMQLDKCTLVFDQGQAPSSSTSTTSNPANTQSNNNNSGRFQVVIARPSFATSDDALVEYARSYLPNTPSTSSVSNNRDSRRVEEESTHRRRNNNNDSEKGEGVKVKEEEEVGKGKEKGEEEKRMLVVTSDRELINRLKGTGVATICRPKEWFQFVAQLSPAKDENAEDDRPSSTSFGGKGRIDLDAWAQQWIDNYCRNSPSVALMVNSMNVLRIQKE